MQCATSEEAGFSSDTLQSVLDLYEKNGTTALMVARYLAPCGFWRVTVDSVKIAQTLTQRFSTRFITFHFSKAYAELDSVKAHAETYDPFFL